MATGGAIFGLGGAPPGGLVGGFIMPGDCTGDIILFKPLLELLLPITIPEPYAAAAAPAVGLYREPELPRELPLPKSALGYFCSAEGT